MRSILVFSIMTVALVWSLPWDVSAMPPREGFVYLSPVPGARHVRPQTQLIFRPSSRVGASWTAGCTVRGSVSGVHHGQWIRAGETWIFKPHHEFTLGEKVSVTVTLTGGEHVSYSFEISDSNLPPRSLEHQIECLKPEQHDSTPAQEPQRTAPATSGALPTPPGFPTFNITHLDNPASGHFFLTNLAFSDTINSPFHLIITDNSGDPVFYRETWNAAVDFGGPTDFAGVEVDGVDGPAVFVGGDGEGFAARVEAALGRFVAGGTDIGVQEDLVVPDDGGGPALAGDRSFPGDVFGGAPGFRELGVVGDGAG